MRVTFTGTVIEWRGPAPFFFVPVLETARKVTADAAYLLTYGWGVIPVVATIGRTTWTTSLFPKDGTYLVPIKAAVRTAEGIGLDDDVTVELGLGADGD